MPNQHSALIERAPDMAFATGSAKDKRKRVPVDLPENRHKWASNDEVEKPTVILRGPNYLIDDPDAFKKASKKRYLPSIVAYAFSGAILITGFMYCYTEMASILK